MTKYEQVISEIADKVLTDPDSPEYRSLIIEQLFEILEQLKPLSEIGEIIMNNLYILDNSIMGADEDIERLYELIQQIKEQEKK